MAPRGLRKPVKGRVNRRIHNGRPAIIVSADPARNILRIREKAVDTAGRCGIPSGQPRQNGAEDPASNLADLVRAEVGLELIPGVAHRRMAIADMGGRDTPNHRLHSAVAAADDKIVTVEVEELDGCRKEREVLTIKLARSGEPLDQRPLDPVLLDPRGHRSWHLHQRVKGRIRIELTDSVEHFLAATHARQPVVNDGDFRWSRLAVSGKRLALSVTPQDRATSGGLYRGRERRGASRQLRVASRQPPVASRKSPIPGQSASTSP